MYNFHDYKIGLFHKIAFLVFQPGMGTGLSSRPGKFQPGFFDPAIWNPEIFNTELGPGKDPEGLTGFGWPIPKTVFLFQILIFNRKIFSYFTNNWAFLWEFRGQNTNIFPEIPESGA